MHKRIVRILLIMVLVLGMTVVAGCRKQDSKEMETPDVTEGSELTSAPIDIEEAEVKNPTEVPDSTETSGSTETSEKIETADLTATPEPTATPKPTATPEPTATLVPTEEPVAKFEFPKMQCISADELAKISYDGIFFAIMPSKGKVDFFEDGDTIERKRDGMIYFYSPIENARVNISLDDDMYALGIDNANVNSIAFMGENGTYEINVKVEDRENSDVSYQATVTLIVDIKD